MTPVSGDAVPPAPPWFVPALLIAATATSVASTDLYTPSLPHLPAVFATDAETVKLTMSMNLLGYAAAVLVHGPLADRFGRRPVVLAGLSAFVVLSLLCAMADSIETLIAARTLQGMAACAQSVIVVIVIRDLYTDAGAVRILAIYGMAVSLTPALAPTIGGYVDLLLGWRANFVLLAGFAAAVLLAIWRLLPETGRPDREALRLGGMVAGYRRLLVARGFPGNLVVGGASLFGLFGFVTAAPFVFVDIEGVPSHHYGLYQAVSVSFYFVGNLAASHLAGRIGPGRILAIGTVVEACAGLLMLTVILTGLHRPPVVTTVMGLYVFGLAFVFASNAVLALKSVPTGTGQAAALLTFAGNGGAALGGFWAGVTHDGSALPVASSLAVGGLGALAARLTIRPPPVPD